MGWDKYFLQIYTINESQSKCFGHLSWKSVRLYLTEQQNSAKIENIVQKTDLLDLRLSRKDYLIKAEYIQKYRF